MQPAAMAVEIDWTVRAAGNAMLMKHVPFIFCYAVYYLPCRRLDEFGASHFGKL